VPKVVQVDGNFDDCLELARKLAYDYPVALVNSVNPNRIEGQKTAAFEVIDELGDAPDVHVIPVGTPGISRRTGAVISSMRRRQGDALPPECGDSRTAGAAPLVLGHPILQPEP
jgi:threonine synthase